MKQLPSKRLEQIVFNNRSRIEEHILIVRDTSTHEEHLSQPPKTNNKQFKVAVTFLTGFNGIFLATSKNIKFYFLKSITDENGYIQITIPPGDYEVESLNNEIKRINIDEGHYTQANSRFSIKHNFSTLASIREI